MPTPPLVGQGYDQLIGTRQNPGQTQAEFYNKETGTGYSSASDLLRAVQPLAGNQFVDESNVFDVLAKGYTPQAQALGQIKSDLNNFQDQTFNSAEESGKRASSSIGDQIGAEQGNYDQYFKEYNDLKIKLNGLAAPNYQQSYNDLRQSSNIGQYENDYAANQKQIRELPYVNRQNFGNAGVATEGQLGADTAQKGIPLEIQQANLLDRLKLAQDFVNNSLKFKELDSDAARQSLSDGLNAALQTIDLSRTHLNDLLSQQQVQKAAEEKAQQFAYENRIGQPFYEIGGTVYRTSDGRPATNPQDYLSMGGNGKFTDVQKVDVSQTFANQLALAQFEQQKVQNDRTYQLNQAQLDQTKYQAITNPVTGDQMIFDPKTGKFTNIGGGINTGDSSSPYFGLSPKLYQAGSQIADDFRNEQIVKDYNKTLNSYQSVQGIINSGVGGAGDLAVVYDFMKALDPSSVVRESEYASAAQSGNIFTGALAKFNGYFKEKGGFLPDNLKQAFLSVIGTKFDVSSKQYQNLSSEYARRIDQATGKSGVGSQFLTDYAGASASDLDSLWNGLGGSNSGGGSGSNGGNGNFTTSQPLDLNAAKKSGGLTFSSVGSGTNNALSKTAGTNTALLTAATTRFPAGSTGGQCGVFVRNIASQFGLTYPTLGDSLQSKTAAVQKYGTSLKNAGIGSVIVTKENPTYGHVAWIIGKNDQGYIVAESNFKQSNKVSYGRVIPYSSNKIIGVINPNLKTRTA